MNNPKKAEEMMKNARPMEKHLLPRLINVTEAAAIAAAHEV